MAKGGKDLFVLRITCAAVVVLVIAFAVLWLLQGKEAKIERSTVNREALPASKCDPVDKWYQDDWGDWIDENGEEKALIAGMEYFYEKTGVQPYLWIMGENGKDYISEGSIEDLAKDTYAEMFGEDGGHLLIIFREYPNASSNYLVTVRPGEDAEEQVMDEQAREILLGYIDYFYTVKKFNEGEFFAKSLEKAGDRIMTKQISQAALYAIIIISVIAVAGVVIVVHIIRKRKVAEATRKAAAAKAEADLKKNEFAQQKYNDHLETLYVAITCPNCGSSNSKIRKGTTGNCQFCGSAIKVDEEGNVVIESGSKS